MEAEDSGVDRHCDQRRDDYRTPAGVARLKRPADAQRRPPVARSVRLRGARRRAMAPPRLAAARYVGLTAATPRGARAGRGRRGAHRAGGWGTWKSGILGTCGAAGARQVFSFSGFQVFTLPRPAPAGGVAGGAASCSDTDRERRETGKLSN